MKNRYTEADCKHLADLFVAKAKLIAANGEPNYLLLSGGLDSVTVLYTLHKAGIPFKAFTFYFKDVPSLDKLAVEKLSQKLHFEHEFIEIPSDWAIIKEDVQNAVKLCHNLWGRIREVKVEVLFALTYVDRLIPKGGNVFTGSEGDALVGYNRRMAITRSIIGEDHPDMISERKLEDGTINEFVDIFSMRHNYSSIYKGPATDFIVGFTMRACNHPVPKAILYHAFADYHREYGSYRKPKPFQKAANEKALFNNIAFKNGYKNALAMFKSMAKEMGL